MVLVHQKSLWKNMTFDAYLTPYTKINPKGIINLTAKGKTVKLLDENTEVFTVSQLWVGKEFKNRPKTY